MDQLAYWNSVAETKEFTTDFQTAVFTGAVDPAGRILDVGCGYGRTLAELWARGYRQLTGVDVSDGLIRRGRALFPQLELRLQSRAGQLDFPDGAFDAVLLCAVLTCIAADGDQRQLISEIRRVLRPGGVLYCNDFLLNSDGRNLERYSRGEARYGTRGVFELPEGAVLRHHSEAHIRALLADFELRTFVPVTYRTMNGHTSNGFYLLAAAQNGAKVS